MKDKFCFSENFLTSFVINPPDIKSSTYQLFLISAILFTLSPFLDSRCASSVPTKTNGDWTSPNNALVHRGVPICFGSFCFLSNRSVAHHYLLLQCAFAGSLALCLHTALQEKICFLQAHTALGYAILDQSLNIYLMKGWKSLIWLKHHTLFAFSNFLRFLS